MVSDLPDLARDYGLQVDALRPHPGGFESDCLVADGTWFVKIWRSHEPPARLDLLSELHAAGLPVAAPVPARSGELHAWWRRRPYAVFPFVRGRAPGEQAIARATARAVPHAVCHRDFLGQNILLDGGDVAAILDWEQAVLAPREHDLWAAAYGRHGEQFLAEYGAVDLDLDHLEYALLARPGDDSKHPAHPRC